MTTVEMPKANENLTEATLDRWLVKEGSEVSLNQPLCEIITDKAKFELPAPAAGVVLKILAPERALLPVGYALCAIGGAGERAPDGLAARNEKLLAAHRGLTTALEALPAGAAPVPLAGGPAVRATPVARRLAKEAGIDLAEIVKKYALTAPVTEKDVRRFLNQEG